MGFIAKLCVLYFLLGSASAFAGVHSFALTLGYGNQEFSEHPSKVEGDVQGIDINYQWLDRLELNLVSRSNQAMFVFPSGDNSQTLGVENTSLELSLQHQGGSIIWHSYTDWLKGHWTTGIQYHDIEGDLSDPFLGYVQLYSIGSRYENYPGSVFFDVNYTFSDYGTGIEVEQFDYGAGKLFMDGKSWIQLRQYWVRSNVPTEFQAFELLTKFWVEHNWLLHVDDVFASYSFGERQLFFDPEGMVLWNNSDILKNYFRAGASWNLPWRCSTTLVYGVADYRPMNSEQSYQSTMMYLELTKQF